MKNTKQKFLSAINNNRLKLIGWKRNWCNYIINIQELTWARNFIDWFEIFVFDKIWIS